MIEKMLMRRRGRIIRVIHDNKRKMWMKLESMLGEGR
jgi:hypothetical protein